MGKRDGVLETGREAVWYRKIVAAAEWMGQVPREYLSDPSSRPDHTAQDSSTGKSCCF